MKKEKIKPSSQLLKPSAATIFRFEVVGIDLNAEKIGNLNRSIAQENNSNIVQLLKNEKAELVFDAVPNSCFAGNLQMIDTYFPEIMAWLMLNSYSQSDNRLMYAVKEMHLINPLHYNLEDRHDVYDYKIKSFLIALISGMMPDVVWRGNQDNRLIMKWTNAHINAKLTDATNLDTLAELLLERVVFDKSANQFNESNGIYQRNGRYYLDLELGLDFIDRS